MAILSYYLAISLDGKIARINGSVDWLDPFQEKLQTPFDFEPFYKTVDYVLMGRKTWDVSRSFEESPFSDKKCLIYSKSLSTSNQPKNISIRNQLNMDEIIQLKKDYLNRIWLVGGADVAGQLMALDLIDEIVLTVIPVLIGDGIPWINLMSSDKKFKFKESYVASSGVIQLVYVK